MPVCVVDSLNCVDWSLLPPPNEEMVALTAGLKGRFQGDPSYEYEIPERKEEPERSFEEETGVSTLGQPGLSSLNCPKDIYSQIALVVVFF